MTAEKSPRSRLAESSRAPAFVSSFWTTSSPMLPPSTSAPELLPDEHVDAEANKQSRASLGVAVSDSPEQIKHPGSTERSPSACCRCSTCTVSFSQSSATTLTPLKTSAAHEISVTGPEGSIGTEYSNPGDVCQPESQVFAVADDPAHSAFRQ